MFHTVTFPGVLSAAWCWGPAILFFRFCSSVSIFLSFFMEGVGLWVRRPGARVGRGFSRDTMPCSFIRYLGRRYPRTMRYLHCRITLRLSARYGVVDVMGPMCTASTNGSGYGFFGTSGLVRCASNVARLLSDVPCDSTVIVGRRVLRCFKQGSCCHFLEGRHLVDPSRRGCVQRLFHGEKVRSRPMCSRCLRHCR